MDDNKIFHYIKMEKIENVENKKHEFLVKNQIISYLYQNKDKIDNFKEFLIELYKDIF